ncbi:hypothetical protein GQ457_03G019160 [Hibiscus cannabinus]
MDVNRNNGQQPADGQELPARADGAITPPAPQMNQQLPARTVRDYLAEDLEGLNPAVTKPDFEAEHFELKPVMFNMQKSVKILKNNKEGTTVNPKPAKDTPAEADTPAQAEEDHNIPLPTIGENSAESSTAQSEETVEKRPPPPFPQRLKNQKQDYQFKKFIDIPKQVHINLPLVEALQQMPNYAKFLKDMVTRKKRIEKFETAAATETCLALMHNKVPAKKTDPETGKVDNPSIEQPPKLELKQLPEQLKYAYLGENGTLPVIISSKLQEDQEEKLIATLRQHKEALGWTIADIKGISPTICMHKILLDDNHKPTVDAQRHLNQAMKDVVRKEILKWLDAGIIYPISDSEWVSPVQCVPKKGGITVISNEKNELIPTRTVTGWRVCVDYRKLNKATQEDHFPLPFIDQMLDQLAGKNCLSNLEKVLKRCKETNLVLNWEKCHFMVDEGIVLGHKISSKGMEVDKAKIEVISKLPPPTTVKGIRSFLGHAGFYRRFIEDFSKITKPLCSLLEQGRPFEFNNDCTKAFNLLKQKLVTAPIVEPPDWKLPFELMCDASDYAV